MNLSAPLADPQNPSLDKFNHTPGELSSNKILFEDILKKAEEQAKSEEEEDKDDED